MADAQDGSRLLEFAAVASRVACARFAPSSHRRHDGRRASRCSFFGRRSPYTTRKRRRSARLARGGGH